MVGYYYFPSRKIIITIGFSVFGAFLFCASVVKSCFIKLFCGLLWLVGCVFSFFRKMKWYYDSRFCVAFPGKRISKSFSKSIFKKNISILISFSIRQGLFFFFFSMQCLNLFVFIVFKFFSSALWSFYFYFFVFLRFDKVS